MLAVLDWTKSLSIWKWYDSNSEKFKTNDNELPTGNILRKEDDVATLKHLLDIQNDEDLLDDIDFHQIHPSGKLLTDLAETQLHRIGRAIRRKCPLECPH